MLFRSTWYWLILKDQVSVCVLVLVAEGKKFYWASLVLDKRVFLLLMIYCIKREVYFRLREREREREREGFNTNFLLFVEEVKLLHFVS